MNAKPGLHSSESPQLNLALLVLRVACALPFLYHGSAILFGVLGGPGPAKFAAFMHVPVAFGYLVGLAQFAGDLAILTGAFLRVGAVCVMIVMLGAIFLVHLPHGFDINQGGYEFARAASQAIERTPCVPTPPAIRSTRCECPSRSGYARTLPQRNRRSARPGRF